MADHDYCSTRKTASRKRKSGVAWCSAINCSNNARNNSELSFFRFPSDAERCKKWVIASRRADLDGKAVSYLHNNCKLCSRHFEDCMFLNFLKNRIKPDALPTLFDIPNPPPTVTLKRKPPKKRQLEFPLMPSKCQNQYPKSSSAESNNLETSHHVIENIHEGITGKEAEPSSEFPESTGKGSNVKKSDSPTSDSPRKKKLQKLAWRWKSRAKRLASQIDHNQGNKKINETDALPDSLKTFVQMLKPGNSKYSNETKQFALSLYFLSPRAYDFVRRHLPLPTPRLLQLLTSNIPVSPGINQWILKILELKASSFCELDKNCIICIDEMSIKKHLYYNSSMDKIIGFVDTGDVRTAESATSVCVVMVRGIASSWKQPVAFYFSGDTCPAECIKNLIIKTLQALKQVGLRVHAVVSDMGSNFVQVAKELSVTPEKPLFELEGGHIYYFFDFPHLIKAVRNNLMQHTFLFENYQASWKDIETLYHMDKTLTFRMVPKLTDTHVHPNNFAKMRVKYATQVLSHSTASAIYANVALKMLPSDAIGTAKFCENFDRLFDCCNSSTLNCTKFARRAFRDNSGHQEILEDMILFIESLRVVNKDGKYVTNTIKCLYGWRVSLHALLELWNELHSKFGFKFLFTRRLNQDALENFFCSIRQGGGNSDNPTPVQFMAAFRKLSLSCEMVETLKSNCLHDSDALITNLGELSKKVIIDCSAQDQHSTENVLRVHTQDFRHLTIAEENGLVYVAGYVMKKCLEQHSCETCKQFAYNHNTMADSSQLLSYFKGYDTKRSDFGGLCVPHNSAVDFIKDLDIQFRSFFDNIKTLPNLGKILLEKCQNSNLEHPCPKFPQAYAVKLFIRLMLHHQLKRLNREKKMRTNSKKKKLAKLQHK